MPRSLSGADAVRAFVAAFNEEDLETLAHALTEDVEIQGSRGLVEGRVEARRWATRRPSGELHQRLVLDEVDDRGAHVVAKVRRQWVWTDAGKPTDDVADEQELYYVATIRDGLICRWAPFGNREDALRAAGAAG